MDENVQVTTVPETGIFDNYETYVDATRWSRFFNFIIDNLFMRFALSWVSGYVVGALLGIIAPEFINNLAYEGETSFGIIMLALLISYFNYIAYYTFCEKVFNGYTLGKLITGTRAIRNDGNPLTFKDALLRSLSRIVPFEALSGFGTPWHDSWTNTRVVKAR